VPNGIDSVIGTIRGEVFVTPPNFKAKSLTRTLPFKSSMDSASSPLKSPQSYLSMDRRKVEGSGVFHLTKFPYESISACMYMEYGK
jgi:hypothetical protein